MSRVNRIVVSSAVLLVGSLCLAFLTKSQGPAVLKEVEPKQTPNAGEGVLSAGAWKSKLKIASPTQTLQGWAKEEDALERLQKKAEKRLKKDVKADDKAAGNDNNEDTANAEAATDAREGIPEDSIRAEAAAMGYSTVRAWREANEHPLDIPLHAKVGIWLRMHLDIVDDELHAHRSALHRSVSHRGLIAVQIYADAQNGCCAEEGTCKGRTRKAQKAAEAAQA